MLQASQESFFDHAFLCFSPQNASILRRKKLVLDLVESSRHSGYGQHKPSNVIFIHSLRFSHSLRIPTHTLYEHDAKATALIGSTSLHRCSIFSFALPLGSAKQTKSFERRIERRIYGEC
jgi:hypothetical protein